MTKFKKYVINKLIRQYDSANPMYPIGVSITGCLVFILFDDFTINYYDCKTRISHMLNIYGAILNSPTINFTAVHACHTYYTFDGKRLIKHIIL